MKETIEVDGEMVPRETLSEPVYGEAPWAACYELTLQESTEPDTLWVRLDHAVDERLRGELDPWKFEKS